jgi:hypothetical protein
MKLEELHEQLRWPEPRAILDPQGAGPQVFVRLVRQKLETPLRRFADCPSTRVGILTGNPATDDTEPPISIVCEFSSAATPQLLREVHKLAWNFCRSPLLITVEPHLVRAWSCYEAPDSDPDAHFRIEPVETLTFDGGGTSVLSREAAAALDWIQLASGQFFVQHAHRFPQDQRADKTLLENLRNVRKELVETIPKDIDHPEDIAHDLLARLIFIQFLFDRKDSRGNAALDVGVLDALHRDGTLSESYRSLAEILENKSDTYALFKWLNVKFNGDLFPGKGTTQENLAAEWEREKEAVSASHLRRLADMVSGRAEIAKRQSQHSLWPLYSFDTIPLEFISSIYEEFVSNRENKRGEHYTPGYLVDFMLDKVLPWGGEAWDLKILDPACGSGIFLVKSFQRLCYRWRNAHPGFEPNASLLRTLLERNLFGVDSDPTAVRVASFSLYLAMCDEIGPHHDWTQVRFPRLRDVTLKTNDFFHDGEPGFQTEEDAARYDLVVGNAPWGPQTLTERARWWADDHGWETVNEQIGTLFLPKAAALTKPTGRICMIQPAGSLLFNRNRPALHFREKLFLSYKIEEIVNLSALRFGLFMKVKGPACIVSLAPTPPDGQPLAYWCPKQSCTAADGQRLAIDAQDLNWVYTKEAAGDPWIWTALAWGGRRDRELIRRMGDGSRRITLQKAIEDIPGWDSSDGFKRRRSAAKKWDELVGLHILENHDLWGQCAIVSDLEFFPKNTDPWFERPRTLDAYRLPILVMSRAWEVAEGRFKAVIVESEEKRRSHLLYSQSFCGVRTPDDHSLASLALVLNSSLAVYYFFLTGGRLGSYLPTLLKEDIEQLPLPKENGITISSLSSMSFEDIDRRAQGLYGLKEVERILVDDFFNISLIDYTGVRASPGRQPVIADEPERSRRILRAYCESFLRVLRAGFGEDKPVCATIFQAESTEPVPFCLVAVHLDWPGREVIVEDALAGDGLLDRLHWLNERSLQAKPEDGSIFYQRVARVYQMIVIGQQRVPTVYLVKPNQVRYWTRSVALRDADEVAADILLWGQIPGGEMEQDVAHA